MNKFEKVSIEQYLKDLSTEKIEKSISQEIATEYRDIKLPKRATKHSAGYDFYAPFDIVLKPNETIKFATSIKCQMNDDVVIKYAMKLTIANGKRNIGYLRTILNNYFANGLKTVVEIMQHEESRLKKIRSYHENKKEMILPDYYTCEITHNESLDITNAEIESLKKS